MNAMSYLNRPSGRERRPKDLGFAEQLLLWAIRLWIIGYRLNNSPDDRLAVAFEMAGIEQGRQRFEEFMVAVTAGAARSLGIHCVCHDTVSEDEQQFLDILRLSQPCFGAGQCRFLLEDLLTVSALPIAAVKAQALALAFNDTGYTFASSQSDVVVSAFVTAVATDGLSH